MSGVRACVYLPPDLAQASKYRGEALGYRSWAGYIAGLIRADMITMASHELPLRVSGMGPANRDRIDAEILERARGATIASTAEVGTPEADNVIEFMRRRDLPRTRTVAKSGHG